VSAASTDDRYLDPDQRRPLVERPGIHVIVWALMTALTAVVVGLHFSSAENRAAAINGRFLETSKDSAPFL